LDVGPAPLPTDIFTTNTSLTSPAPAVTTGAASFGNVVFLGNSNVYGAIGTSGNFLLGVYGGATVAGVGQVVNFYGPVSTTTTYVSGTGTLNFLSPSTNLSSGGLIFQGDGTISLAPGTGVIGAITTTAGDNTGTLVLDNASTLNGAVGAGSAALKAIDVVSSTPGGTATISGAVNAYTFNLNTNTLNVGGALTIANTGAGGVINTTVASSTVYGNIRPVGATNLGSTLTINVSVAPAAIIAPKTIFNIVQTQTGTAQSGNAIASVVTVNSVNQPLNTFVVYPVGSPGTTSGVQLVQIIDETGSPILIPVVPPVVPLPPTVPIAVPVVPVLVNAGPVLAPVVAAINALPTAAAVVNAEAQLSPSTPDLVAPLVTFQGTRQFEDLLLSRLDESLCGQVSHPNADAGGQVSPSNADTTSCRWNQPQSAWWMKGFGYFGNQGAHGPFSAYNSIIAGTMIGYDMPLVDMPFGGETRVGLGVGYARNIINGDRFGATTDFNTYQATAYIGHEHGPWFLYGDVSFGWNDYSGRRPVLFPLISEIANAGYSGQDYTGFVTTGYHFSAKEFTITPLASLQYTHENLGNYTETGGGLINLAVNSQSYDFLESGLGVKVERAFGSPNGTYVPEIHAKWYHDFLNPAMQNTAAFAIAGSPSFTTPKLRGASDTFNPGIGLTFLSCACAGTTWTLEGVYDYFWRSDAYSASQIMLRLTGRF
jgi:uncharacterized protein with beta-barrel porin domain